MDGASGVAVSLPAVIDIDVFIAHCLHPAAHQHVCLCTDNPIAHFACKWFQLFQPNPWVAFGLAASSARPPIGSGLSQPQSSTNGNSVIFFSYSRRRQEIRFLDLPLVLSADYLL